MANLNVTKVESVIAYAGDTILYDNCLNIDRQQAEINRFLNRITTI